MTASSQRNSCLQSNYDFPDEMAPLELDLHVYIPRDWWYGVDFEWNWNIAGTPKKRLQEDITFGKRLRKMVYHR